jgi:mannose-6-phosphate isomerase-like protein (cupin superfamily)
MADSLPPVFSLQDEFDAIAALWSPRIVAELNGQAVKLARVDGDFVWHDHPDEDEFFLVLDGVLRIEFGQGAVELRAGQGCVVPKGVRHRPRASGECRLLLFEPITTGHTGNGVTPLTRSLDEQRPA